MIISRRALVQLAAVATAISPIPARAARSSKIKVLELLARKDGTTHDEFMRHWLSVHGPMATQIPGLRCYVAQEVVSHPPVRKDIVELSIPVDIDGIAELWFDDREALDAALRSEAGRAWLADKALFVGAMKGFVGRQEAIVPMLQPTPALKSNAFLVHKPGTTPDEFRRNWHAVHGAMAVKVPYLGGFILFDATGGNLDEGIAQIDMIQVDGIAETYFASHEDQLKMIATPEAKAWFADGSQTMGQIKSYNTTATVFMTPPSG